MKTYAFSLIGLGLCLPAQAQDRRPQYRMLTLADGREITAEILSTEAEGLAVRTTQGESLISFERLKDMSPVDKSTFELGESWLVYLAAPEALQPSLMEGFGWVEGVSVRMVGASVSGISDEISAAAAACEGDLGCLVGATRDTDWMWVVTVSPQPDGPGLQAFSGINTGATRTRFTTEGQTRQDVWDLVHASLELEIPDSGPPKERVAKASRSQADPKSNPTPAQADINLTALTLSPLPGLPAMKQGNGGRAAAAWLIAGAGTAAWIGAVGSNAQSAPELAAVGALGWYSTTVFANHLTAKRP